VAIVFTSNAPPPSPPEDVGQELRLPASSQGCEPMPCPPHTIPPPKLRELWSQPLPHLQDRPVTRWTCRLVLSLFRHQLVSISGIEHIHPANDPFIVAINHSQRPEALLVPSWLVYFRRGRQVHFLSDWNFLMLPVIGQIMQLNEPIIVGRKSARPKWLNCLKPWLTDTRPAMDRATNELRRLRSIGIFPEGTVNRHPTRLLRGLSGTAKLSLETGLPIVPIGLKFPNHPANQPISDRNRFSIHIGPPLFPPYAHPPNAEVRSQISSNPTEVASSKAIEAWHAVLMTELARLSGKHWSNQNPRTKNENQI